ncbi:testis-expressed protein 11-like isoform X1 [Haliotis rufescens]|uniref:testis-expressed protein 11-like isoform X1 n=1 Tax=Haliotis rufescens TaxID=6454 RepID=UPI00201EDF94|nr:testis-expressed protein 11-like isoform X1 [Haliotis rufescens]XP_046374291.2 testis-expressed protein 11-like isoform X1 [Haliotis rufescens]
MSNTAEEIIQIVGSILEKENTDDGVWLKLLDEALRLISSLHSDYLGGIEKTKCITGTFQLETCGVSLWNHAVGLKTKGSLSTVTNAKLRHLSFMIVAFANQGVLDEDTLKKQIVMGMKTGRAWIDACQPEQAEIVLNISNQCAQKLHSIVIERKNETGGGSDVMERQRAEIEKDMFKLLCYKAEVEMLQCRNEAAVNLVQMSKQMLPRFPRESGFLSMLCYNFGVDLYQKKKHDEAINWLRESFDLSKERKGVMPRNQARTLRLLANAYIESNPSEHFEKALNAVSLANAEHCHPAGLYLKLRILLIGGEKGAPVSAVLDDIIKHSDCTLELGLSVLQLLKQHKSVDNSMDFPSQLRRRFEQCPDVGRIFIAQLQALLESDQSQQAKLFTEECITAHNTGRPLDINTRKQFHLVFWEQAGAAFECKEYGEALTWYNYSLSLFSPSEMTSANMAKLQRNRASCFVNQGLLSQAKESIRHAEKCAPDEAHTHFIIYKIALAEGDPDTASSSLQKMVTGGKDGPNVSQSQAFGLICLAAQMALEQNHCDTACMALDFLITHSADHQQTLTALRCLVRLRLGQADMKNYCSESLQPIIPLIRTAYNKLLILGKQPSGEGTQEEATWFMKIAWNLALKCEDDPFNLKDLFSLCLKLLSLLPADRALVCRQKTCTLMAVAGCLQMARALSDDDNKRDPLEEALCYIGEFQCLQREQDSVTWTQIEDTRGPDTTDMLLLLYEFEARVKLQDNGAEAVLEKALTLPQPEPKTFEALAALAVEPPASDRSLSIRALKVAIRTHLQVDQPDFNRCSKDIHSLIQLSMSIGQSSSTQETFNYFKETIDVIDKKANGHYPELEIVWLMTKAWNCGIHFYSSTDYDEAERWCSMSMGLLKYLTTMRPNYEDQMNSVYGEILERIEQARGQLTMEE